MTAFPFQQQPLVVPKHHWPTLPTTPRPRLRPLALTRISSESDRLQKRKAYVILPPLTLPFYVSEAERSFTDMDTTPRPCVAACHTVIVPPGTPVPARATSTSPSFSPIEPWKRFFPALKAGVLLGVTLVLDVLFCWWLWNRLFTLVIVSWLLVLILIANITSRYVQRRYQMGFTQMLTTLRLAALRSRREQGSSPVVRNPQLANLHDTTAYLQALRQEYLSSLPHRPRGTR